MIIHGRIVEQAIDRGERETFAKEIVVTGGRIPLAMVRKRKASDGGGTHAPVLLVHGFGQNRYAWHLPARSLANHLAAAGFDTFNLDLRGHGRSRQLGARRCRSVEEYVREDLPSAIAEVQAQSGQRSVFVVGHSLGGLVAYGAAPELTGAIAGIASLGSPYHFTRGSLSLTAVSLLVSTLNGKGTPFVNPSLSIKHVGVALNALRRVAESPIYPIPWRGWHKGALEPEVLEQHFALAFDRAGLGELVEMFSWGSAGHFLGEGGAYVERFEKLDLPLLVLAGIHDDLAPPASVRPAYERSRSKDKTYSALPLGHIDLLMGRDAPLMTWSVLRRWLEVRAGVVRESRPASAPARAA